MSSLHAVHQGSLSVKPFEHASSGRIAGVSEHERSGELHGPRGVRGGIHPDSDSDSPASAAAAEIGNLISSLGSLSSQAQSLPLSPPSLPGLPQNPGYQPATTDYTQFVGDAS